MLKKNTIETAKIKYTDKTKNIDFISKSLAVDFIAYDDLQAQAARSVYEEMQRLYLGV